MSHSACVCGHKDIHHPGKMVLNNHLELVDEDVIRINWYSLASSEICEPSLSFRADHSNKCPFVL